MTGHIDKLEDAVRGAQQAWEFRTSELRTAVRERDEARAEAEHLRRTADDTWAEVERLRANWEGLHDVLHGLADEVGLGRTTSHDGISFRALDHEVRDRIVKRLRAAQQLPDCGHPNHGGAEHRCEPFLQQLPDVGPVTTLGDMLTCGPERDWATYRQDPDRLRMFAARYLAVAAFLDAEADNTSSDDEVEELAQVLQAADGSDLPWEQAGSQDAYRRLARAAIAHRARGGQEAEQPTWADAQRDGGNQ